MARLFDADGEYLEETIAIVSGTPMAMIAWVYPTGLSVNRRIVTLNTNGATTSIASLWQESANRVVAQTFDGSNAPAVTAPSSLSAESWQCVSGLWASDALRVAYIGSSAVFGQNTLSQDPHAGLNNVSIGRNDWDPGQYWRGRIAEVAIWDLTDWGDNAAARRTAWEAAFDDMSGNAKSALFYPTGLAAYWKLLGDNSPEPDASGNGNSISAFGVTQADHPAITYPAAGGRPRIVGPLQSGDMNRGSILN